MKVCIVGTKQKYGASLPFFCQIAEMFLVSQHFPHLPSLQSVADEFCGIKSKEKTNSTELETQHLLLAPNPAFQQTISTFGVCSSRYILIRIWFQTSVLLQQRQVRCKEDTILVLLQLLANYHRFQ